MNEASGGVLKWKGEKEKKKKKKKVPSRFVAFVLVAATTDPVCIVMIIRFSLKLIRCGLTWPQQSLTGRLPAFRRH